MDTIIKILLVAYVIIAAGLFFILKIILAPTEDEFTQSPDSRYKMTAKEIAALIIFCIFWILSIPYFIIRGKIKNRKRKKL